MPHLGLGLSQFTRTKQLLSFNIFLCTKTNKPHIYAFSTILDYKHVQSNSCHAPTCEYQQKAEVSTFHQNTVSLFIWLALKLQYPLIVTGYNSKFAF